MSEQEVLDLVQRWAAAELNGDADGLGQLLADDFTAIGPLGFVLNKQQWAGRYRGGDLKNTAFDVKEPQVRFYGDVAIVIAAQEQQTTYKEHDTSGAFRLTVVAVRSENGWALASLQLSGPLGPPPSAPPSFR